MTNDPRYPYTHADDYIRSLAGYNEKGTKISRADASQIIHSICEICDLDSVEVFNRLADYYLAHEEEISKRSADTFLKILETNNQI